MKGPVYDLHIHEARGGFLGNIERKKFGYRHMWSLGIQKESPDEPGERVEVPLFAKSRITQEGVILLKSKL